MKKIKTIKPWEEEIYGYENHYNHLPKSNRYASLEKIISILKAFEQNKKVKEVNLLKYPSEENKEKFAYDLGFPIYRSLSDWNGGHHRVLAGIIGKYPIEINEMPFGNLNSGRIPEEYKIDFASMDIMSDPSILKKCLQRYDFPEELKTSEKIPTIYEISEFLEEKKDRRVTSDELMTLYH